MASQEAVSRGRRRGGVALGAPIVERDAELTMLSEGLAAARDGAGSVVFIEAPFGGGKSRLLAVATDIARTAGMQVLAGRGTELEQDFPFGVAIQLFEPPWLSAAPEDRPGLFAGPARWAEPLLIGSLPERDGFAEDHWYAVVHGLYWLTRNLVAAPGGTRGAARRPAPALAVLVDDLQWTDRPTVRFLAYLAERVAELPVALVVAARTGESATDPPAVTALRAAAADAVLQPASLSERGVTAIVQSQLPESDPAFGRACAHATNGNPFLVVSLVEHVRASGARLDTKAAAGLEESVPESVLDMVGAQLSALPAEVVGVATAVAVLGDGASLRHAARLAELEVEATSRAADTLARLHLLHPGTPLSFVHPLVRSAVRASVSALALGQAHRRAASILGDDGASPELVGAHLLFAPPASDSGAIEVLRAAARTALARGDAARAVRMLERALAEGPPPDTYPEVLAELGQAELAAGHPDAVQKLERAIDVTDERFRRTELALAAVGDLPSAGRRAALAHLASLWSVQGGDRSTIVSLAELAWGQGSLLEHRSANGPVWPLLARALLFVDELELALEVCDAAVAGGRERPALADQSAAAAYRAWALYEQGRVAEALAAADADVVAAPKPWQVNVPMSRAARAACHVQRAEFAQAEAALSIIDGSEASGELQLANLLDVRAQLRLAQRRPDEALADALEAGRRLQSEHDEVGVGAVAWRSTAALARLALGDRAEADRLAREELEQARPAGITRVVIRDLRVLGLAARGSQRLDILTEAASAGDGYPPRLEHTRALIDLGAALRRANHRAAARDPLRRGLERSHRDGVTALANQALGELAATGARPRRATFTGVEALTPGERRVADLAAQGLTTRQVAQALFVTPKTVEFHLRHIYRKLGVNSRADLARTIEEHRADGAGGDAAPAGGVPT